MKGTVMSDEISKKILRDARDAKSFEELSKVALWELQTRNSKVSIVCGPITTGGAGTREYNLMVFKAVIQELNAWKVELFDQMPYETSLKRLAQKWCKDGNTGYCTPILERFFKPIFESGYIERAYFIHGWFTSHGAKWGHQTCIRTGITMLHLNSGEISAFLRGRYTPKHVKKLMTNILAA